MRTIPELKEGTHRAKASGTLPNGKPVIVNADGTVSVVEETSISEGVGSNVTFESATTTFIGSAYDATAQKVVIAYRDGGNSNRGTAVVGAVSGTSISFGTPVTFNAIETNNISVAHDLSAGKTIVCCNEVGPTSEDGVVYVGTVSGTSISFGSRQVFKSASVYPVEPSIAYDSTNSKIVIAYEHENNTLSGIVGTVSGSSVAFGSPTTIASATVTQVRTLHDSVNNKIVVLYSDLSNGDYGKAAVGTVSGTSISFGSVVTFESASTQDIAAAFDTANGKVVAVFRDGNNSAYGTGIVGTVSGTSISFGTPVVFESASVDWLSAAYNVAAGKVIIAYQDKGNSDTGTYVEGTVSGTSISFNTPTIFPSEADAIYTSVAYDSDQYAAVISFMNIDNASYGTAFSYQSAASVTNLTSENYIGMSQGFVAGETVPQAVGSETVFEADSTLETTCAFDSNSNKVVIAYRDFGNSNYGTAIVGTVNGNSITFGSPVVFNSANTNNNSAVFDSLNNKIVISFQDSNGYGAAIVGTVSGSSISFGSKTTFLTSTLSWRGATFDSNANKVVISYADNGNSAYGTAIVGTVSGTSISFGTPAVFESANTDNTAITFDSSNNKIVIAYQDAGNSNYGTAVVGTVSGTSISFGTPVVFESQDSDQCAITFDSFNNKVVIAYQDDGGNNSRYGTAIVGTVSGTSISFGSPSIFESANTDSITASFDSNANKVVIQYRDGGNSDYGTIVSGTVSGNSITFTSPLVFNTGNTGANSSVFDSNANKVVIAYQDGGNSAYGTSVVFQPEANNIVRGQVNAGSSATVDIIGSLSTNQSGLTAGQSYYVQTDGTIGETPADPSVFAGTAISATSLVVKT